jgi:hypothetical protein
MILRNFSLTLAVSLFASTLSLITASAQVITQWNFNSSPSDNNASTGRMTPSVGTGNLTLLSVTNNTYGTSFQNGLRSTDPAPLADDSVRRLGGFPTIVSNSGTAGFQALVDTTGQQNIVITWDQNHTAPSSRYARLQYTLNGGTSWIDYAARSSDAGLDGTLPASVDSGLYVGKTTGNSGNWINQRRADLRLIPSANNNPQFGFRVVSAFIPNGVSYTATSPNLNYSPNGEWLIDMVTVSSVPFTGLEAFRVQQGLALDGTQDLEIPAMDGISNLFKYAFNMIGTGPGQAASVNTPNHATLTATGNAGLPLLSRNASGQLTLTYIRRKTIPDTTVASNVSYEAEANAGLNPNEWFFLSPSFETTTSIDSFYERVVVTDVSVNSQRRFLRVLIRVN